MSDDEVYEVEGITDRDGRGRNVRFAVKWVGYKDVTWEPAANLAAGSSRLLEVFNEYWQAGNPQPVYVKDLERLSKGKKGKAGKRGKRKKKKTRKRRSRRTTAGGSSSSEGSDRSSEELSSAEPSKAGGGTKRRKGYGSRRTKQSATADIVDDDASTDDGSGDGHDRPPKKRRTVITKESLAHVNTMEQLLTIEDNLNTALKVARERKMELGKELTYCIEHRHSTDEHSPLQDYHAVGGEAKVRLINATYAVGPSEALVTLVLRTETDGKTQTALAECGDLFRYTGPHNSRDAIFDVNLNNVRAFVEETEVQAWTGLVGSTGNGAEFTWPAPRRYGANYLPQFLADMAYVMLSDLVARHGLLDYNDMPFPITPRAVARAVNVLPVNPDGDPYNSN